MCTSCKDFKSKGVDHLKGQLFSPLWHKGSLETHGGCSDEALCALSPDVPCNSSDSLTSLSGFGQCHTWLYILWMGIKTVSENMYDRPTQATQVFDSGILCVCVCLRKCTCIDTCYT